jgi:release factor glutamine methyltransferase
MKINKLLQEAGRMIDRKEAVLLLAHAVHKTEAFVLAYGEQNIPKNTAIRFLKMAKDRMRNKPIAYILGKQPFCGLDFKVNKHVLIPRPETEELVLTVADNVNNSVPRHTTRTLLGGAKLKQELKSEKGNRNEKKNSRPREVVIIDIGTGSGCIACSLKKMFNDATVFASDNSPTTLSVVKHNDNKLSTGIKVIHSNLFSGALRRAVTKTIAKTKRVDLHVIANLPYLPHSDKDDMQKDVIAHEPKSALFADENGMALIKKCMQQLHEFLLPHPVLQLNSTLYFEIDPRQKSILQSYAKRLFTKSRIQIKKDLSGRDRFLIISNRD